MNGLAYVREWVRGLVILALLGTCLELLVPSSGMKKYVRMTMGLLVVLAVVRPVASLLGHPVPLEVLAPVERPDPHLPTLGQIMNQAAEFRQRSQALAAEEARVRLEAAARAAALSVGGVGEAAATVSVRSGPAGPEVVGVTVTVRTGRGERSPAARVPPVSPVPGTGVAPEAVRPAEAPVPPAHAALADAVRREVAARLGMSADPQLVKVHVQVPAAERARR